MADPDNKILARLYDPVMSIPENRMLPEHREWLAANLRGRVLELGAGTGAMFPYFCDLDGIELHAIEPDQYMRRQAVERAAELNLDVTITDAVAESLPYDDDSFDVVVASLVFCTIPDPEKALSEVARILRPGGEFLFFEHVRASGVSGRIHDLLTPAWHAVAGGCHLSRETGTLFQSDERFRLLEYERLGGGILPLIRGRMERVEDRTGLQRAVNALTD